MKPLIFFALLTALCLPAAAKLPPVTDQGKLEQAEAAKAKAAHASKVAAYQLCLVQDRVAESYLAAASAAGKTVQPSMPTGACTDPGPGPTAKS